VWNIIARDTILPVAYLALIITALAVRNRSEPALAEGQVLVTAFLVGGVLSILADLTFLAAAQYWHQTGSPDRPGASTVAARRTVDGIQIRTQWPEAFGLAILAGGLVALVAAPVWAAGEVWPVRGALPLGIADRVVAAAGVSRGVLCHPDCRAGRLSGVAPCSSAERT